MAKKHHKFTHTHVEHHSDGSHTVHHVHQDGPAHDKKHAVANLDELHDSMQDHLGAPNPGELESAAAAPAPAAGPVAAAPPVPAAV